MATLNVFWKEFYRPELFWRSFKPGYEFRSQLTGIDAVTLFGPETPLLFVPPGPRSHPIYASVACSPCVNAYNNRQTACRNNICMKSITVDQVFETASRIYRQRTSAPR